MQYANAWRVFANFTQNTWNAANRRPGPNQPPIIVRIARGVAALLLLLGIFMPWVWMDDAKGPYNGADMAIYLFIGPDTGFLVSRAFLRGILFLLMPVVIVGILAWTIINCGWSCWDVRRSSALTNAMDLAKVIIPIAVFLWAAAPALDERHLQLFGFPMPVAGLLLIVVASVALATLEIWKR